MEVRLLKLITNFFTITYTEKNAIRGHSVARYHYAVQLINDGSDESLIKAYAWLSLAADEIDMKKVATHLKHKIHFELQNRGLYEQAKHLETDYFSKYSAEAERRRLENSYNPLDVYLRFAIYVIDKLAANIDCLDTHLFKKKGSAFAWGFIGACSSLSGFVLFLEVLTNPNRINIIMIAFSILCCIISSATFKSRTEQEGGWIKRQ